MIPAISQIFGSVIKYGSKLLWPPVFLPFKIGLDSSQVCSGQLSPGIQAAQEGDDDQLGRCLQHSGSAFSLYALSCYFHHSPVVKRGEAAGTNSAPIPTGISPVFYFIYGCTSYLSSAIYISIPLKYLVNYTEWKVWGAEKNMLFKWEVSKITAGRL